MKTTTVNGWRAYLELTKPGIIRGNLLTAAAGFFLASSSQPDWSISLSLAAGLSLVIASGCVTNNFIDRAIDAKMTRTHQRVLVTGIVSGRSALVFASVLGVAGGLILLLTNLLTASLAAFGWLAYVVLYGVAKRHGTYSTLVGSISGALPPVIGYSAVTGQLDTAAALLFLILVCWQMPHFYAIAIYRHADYSAANIPLLSTVKSITQMKWRIIGYISLFTVVTFILAASYTSSVWLRLAGAAAGLGWLFYAVAISQKRPDDWAKQIFRASLLVILAQCILIAALPSSS